MLDAARAALRFCDDAVTVTPPAEDRIFFQGHSQGGQAALFAHEFWSSYAPELNVLGTVALAPGSEGRFITQQMAEKTISLITGSALLGMNAQRAYYGARILRPGFKSHMPLRWHSELKRTALPTSTCGPVSDRMLSISRTF